MARTKGSKNKKTGEVIDGIEVVAGVISVEVVPTPIEKLPIDHTSEGLNNMAKKINEIIDQIS